MHPQTESAQNMTATKQMVPPSNPKEGPSNLLNRNEAHLVQTTTVDTTLKGKSQTSKGNGDDIQIDDSLTGIIVDTDDPQDTQAEIMGNNTIKEANAPLPQNPLDIDTEGNVGYSERDTYKKQHETSTEKGTCDLPPTDDEFSKTTNKTSPKRTKKLITERDLTYTRERTRSKSPNIKAPPTNPIV